MSGEAAASIPLARSDEPPPEEDARMADADPPDSPDAPGRPTHPIVPSPDDGLPARDLDTGPAFDVLCEGDLRPAFVDFLFVNLADILKATLFYQGVGHFNERNVRLDVHRLSWVVLTGSDTTCLTDLDREVAQTDMSISKLHREAAEVYMRCVRMQDRLQRSEVDDAVNDVLDLTTSVFEVGEERVGSDGFLKIMDVPGKTRAFEESDYMISETFSDGRYRGLMKRDVLGDGKLDDDLRRAVRRDKTGMDPADRSASGALLLKPATRVALLQRIVISVAHLLLDEAASHVKTLMFRDNSREEAIKALYPHKTTSIELWRATYRKWFKNALTMMNLIDAERHDKILALVAIGATELDRCKRVVSNAKLQCGASLLAPADDGALLADGAVAKAQETAACNLFSLLDDDQVGCIVIHLPVADRAALRATSRRMWQLPLLGFGCGLPGPHIEDHITAKGYFPTGYTNFKRSQQGKQGQQGQQGQRSEKHFYVEKKESSTVTVTTCFGYFVARDTPLRCVTADTGEEVPGHVHEGDTYKGELVVLEPPPERIENRGPDVAGCKESLDYCKDDLENMQKEEKELLDKRRRAQRDEEHAQRAAEMANFTLTAAREAGTDTVEDRLKRDAARRDEKAATNARLEAEKRHEKQCEVRRLCETRVDELTSKLKRLEEQRNKWLSEQPLPSKVWRDRRFVNVPDSEFFGNRSIFSIDLVDSETLEAIPDINGRSPLDMRTSTINKKKLSDDDARDELIGSRQVLSYRIWSDALRTGSNVGSKNPYGDMDDLYSALSSLIFFERPKQRRCTSMHESSADWAVRVSPDSIYRFSTAPMVIRWVKMNVLTNKTGGRKFRLRVCAFNSFVKKKSERVVPTLEQLRLEGLSKEDALSKRRVRRAAVHNISDMNNVSRDVVPVCLTSYSVEFVVKAPASSNKRKRSEPGPGPGPGPGPSSARA